MIYGDAVAMDGGEILLTKAIDGGEVGMLSSMDGGEIGAFTPVITGDYEQLDNKPSINGVTLEGDLSTADLHIQAGVTSWNGQTGDVVYTPPEVPVQSVNGQTGAVVLDASDVGALPDSTAIPTKTSDLTNDSGFVNATQAASAAPVQSVNGQTGAVTITEGLAPLIGATTAVTPTQVSSALAEGRDVLITHLDNTFGVLEFSAFNEAATVGCVVSNTLVYYYGTMVAYQLIGWKSVDEWETRLDILALSDDIPTNVSSLNNDAGYVNAAQAASAAPVQSVNGQTGAVSLTIPTVPTNVSAFSNDANYITASGAPVQSVNGDTGTVVLDATDVGALPDTTKYAGSATVGGVADKAMSIPFGKLDATSTATVMTATVPGITELKNGVCMWLTNGVVTGGSNFTLNINGLGAKGVYSSQAATSRVSSVFNVNYTGLFIYNEDRVSGGCWDYVYGYDSNTNTIGYQVRTNSMSLPMTSITYRYRLLFQSADNAHWVPATNSTSTNATAARTVCQDPINPFGDIRYYGTTASVAAGGRPSASYLWQEYAFNLGYSFQKSPNYVLTEWAPIYLKCAPQPDNSAIIDDTEPFVQALPATADGLLYIYLGVAYSTTNIELTLNHPIYYIDANGRKRIWTGEDISIQ